MIFSEKKGENGDFPRSSFLLRDTIAIRWCRTFERTHKAAFFSFGDRYMGSEELCWKKLAGKLSPVGEALAKRGIQSSVDPS